MSGLGTKPTESIQDYRLLIESITDYAIYRLSPDGIITSWNPGAERAKGYTFAEIKGQHFSVFFTPEDRADGRPEKALAIARTAGRYIDEGWRVRKDGTRFWASVVIDPILDENGELVGFAKVTRDLTERQASEEALRVAHGDLKRRVAEFTLLGHRALDESEERFRRVVEAAPNAMVMINAAGHIEMVNAQAERVFGYSRGEMLGQPVEMLVPLRFRGHHPALRTSFSADPRSRPMGAGRDPYGLKKDGTEFPVEIGLNPIETDEGPMVLSAIVDIGDRIQLEAQLHQAQKMEAVGRLTTGVAHDFNNLLQTMMGSMQLLEDRVGTDLRSRELVRRSIDAAQRGAMLTHHMLAFSRKQMLVPSRIDIAALLHKTLTLLERTLGPNILIRANEEGIDQHAFADPAQLEACILNLAINARDAMPKGGSLTIRAYGTEIDQSLASETLPIGDYIVVVVEDTGDGIRADILEKVFEPFFTTKGIGRGSGLGLSMAMGFARQSGGDVRITSTHGEGTRVEVFLPAAGSPAGKATETPRRSAGRILLVDDASDVLVTLSAFLEGADFNVTKARTADDALRVIASPLALSAIVTDYAMPGMSGAELLSQAAKIRPQLPGMIVSGHPSIDSVRELGAGVQVLRKPFLRAELLERVRVMVEQSVNQADGALI